MSSSIPFRTQLTFSFAVVVLPFVYGCAERGDQAPAPATPSVAVSTSSARAVALIEEKIAAGAADHTALTILGELQLRKARETGEIVNYLLAEDSFRKALAKEPGYLTAKAFLAGTLLSQHRFAEALELAREVHEANPERIDARTVMTDVRIETGDYGEAERMLEELLDRTSDPAIVARQAGLAEIRGDLRRATELMSLAASRIADSGAPRDEAAWYFARLASLLTAKGDLLAAADEAQRALSIYPEHAVGLRALAVVRHLQGSDTEAMRLLEREIKARPSPGAYFMLVDLYGRLGLEEDARRMADKGLAAAKAHPLGERVYRRDVARFLADHERDPGAALELARLEASERSDVRTLDLLAWTLHKAGASVEALPVARKAVSSGTLDQDVLLHAGIVELAAGDARRGEELLHKVIATRINSPQAESAAAALEAHRRPPAAAEASEVIDGREP